MKKEIVLNSNLKQFNQLSPAEYKILSQQLIDYEKSQLNVSTEDLARGILKDLPYIPMIHDAAVRNYLEKIAMNTSVIKVIAVVYFIASLILGIVFLSKFGK